VCHKGTWHVPFHQNVWRTDLVNFLDQSDAAYSAGGPAQIQLNAAAGVLETRACASASDATPTGAPQPRRQRARPQYPPALPLQTNPKDHASSEEDGRHNGGGGRPSPTPTPARYANTAT